MAKRKKADEQDVNLADNVETRGLSTGEYEGTVEGQTDPDAEGGQDVADAGESGNAKGDRAGQRAGGAVTGVNFANREGVSVEADLD